MATATAPVTAPDKTILAKGYVRPELLVSTDWLAANLDNPSIRVIERNGGSLHETKALDTNRPLKRYYRIFLS